MNTWAWIGMIGIIVFTLVPFLEKKNRTRPMILKAIATIIIVLGIIGAVLFFEINYVIAFIVGLFLLALLEPKTYTKKGVFIYSSIIIVIGIGSYLIFRDNPDYVLKHLKEHPESTSLYFSKNGENLIAYQSDVVRPLASTVKILIAAEYAMQINENKLQKDSLVSLSDLEKFHFKNTDGNAHVEWLEALKEQEKITNNSVTLHDVVKGMITYSSNANTDYLIYLLGEENINNRAKTLGLTQHEKVYPIVGAIYIPIKYLNQGMDEEELLELLNNMSMEEYRTHAWTISNKIKDGEIILDDSVFELSTKIQKIWSDRLIGASANDYGRLMTIISNEELPTLAADTLRDVMEWPMQLNEANKEYFQHIGSKGGSTLFILNNAMYAQTNNQEQMELVLFFNDLNLIERLLISNNIHSFESKMLREEDYRLKVIQDLE